MLQERLRALRKQQGLSQKELSQHLGITQQAVGKWETGRSSPDPDTLLQLAQLLQTSVDDLLGHPSAPSPAGDEYAIPVIGTVRAGYNSFAMQEDLGVEYARVKNPDRYFYLIVKGDSMEPRIHDGDLALVHRQNTLENGDLGVMVYGDGEGTLKRFIRQGNSVILQPFNPSYQPQVLMGEELEHLYIAGRVVETKTKW
ncbi:MAG: XRE family transcriptional regulator [Candidatus Fournierella pullistercoris]|uniref:XRE family transcriptional regulator n=1 Tax=Candidatus Allofournierella pullistercoris TaxID=2838597 RepID=A0A948T3L8_9FIRM|nr:XRE family transcriptional regulator [Candidatus Fournierella pullistercoris]